MLEIESTASCIWGKQALYNRTISSDPPSFPFFLFLSSPPPSFLPFFFFFLSYHYFPSKRTNLAKLELLFLFSLGWPWISNLSSTSQVLELQVCGVGDGTPGPLHIWHDLYLLNHIPVLASLLLVLFEIKSEVDLLEYMVILYLSFFKPKRKKYQFSTVTTSFYFVTSSVQFLLISTTLSFPLHSFSLPPSFLSPFHSLAPHFK